MNHLNRIARTVACLALFIPFSASAVDFIEGWSLPQGAASTGVALGDIDQDNDVDIYITDNEGPDRLYLNDGTGKFTLSPQVLDSGRGTKPAMGLLDAGAFPDLALPKHLSTTRVWLNDGAGTLVDSAQSLGASSSKGTVALGPLDAGATLDMFIAANGSANEVLTNDGAGVFTNTGQALGDAFSTDVVLVDVGEDGNGDLDAVVGNNGFNKVYFNDGAGVFTDSGENVGGITSTFGVAAGLLNGDSVIDLFFANGNNSGEPNTVWFGDGDGTFSDSGQSLGNQYSISVVLHDFDGQNGPDAFVCNNANVMDRLWLNDGSGGFSDANLTLGLGACFDSEKALINNDAHMDVVVANRYNPDQIWLGDGAGGFTNSDQVLGSNMAQSVDLADIDNDGDLDAVLGSIGGTARILTNDGDGNFTDTGQWLATHLGNNANKVVFANLDNANGPDVFIATSPQGGAADQANRVFFNNGSGIFTDSGQTLGAANSGAVAVGNVDGDSDVDIFVGNAPYLGQPGDNILYTNSNGTLTDSGQNFGQGNTRAAALVDLDGDTDLDLFIGNVSFGGSNPANKVFLNGENSDPLGTFSDTGQSLGTGDSQALAFGLLNNDAHVDVFVGNDGFNTVWFGDGAGNFSDSGQALGHSTRDTHGVHLYDFDDNGTLDAFVTNSGSTNNAQRVWTNDGDGNFTDSGLVLGGGDSQGSAMGDLDGDTQADVFVANQLGDHTVWLNNSAPTGQQIITPTPGAQEASISDPVAIDVIYTTSDDDESLTGIGLRVHWDSSKLAFVNLTSVWAPDKQSEDSSCQNDNVSNFDGDANTDCYLEVVWFDGGDNFPGSGNTPTHLYTANFMSAVPFSDSTFVKFSASALVSGYTLNANAASVTNPDDGTPEYDPDKAADTTLPFGDVVVLQDSAPQTISVNNTGSGPLTMLCNLSGTHSAQYTVINCPSPVAAGGSTQIGVRCRPVSTGLKTATLQVVTNDADESLNNYPLTCTGVQLPEFVSNPVPTTSLAFGDVEVATSSTPENVQIGNTGTGNLTIGCALSGGDADQFTVTACSSPVIPASNTNVSVTCDPTTIGPKAASLDITTNDADEMNVSWPLTCNSVPPDTDTVFEHGFEDSDGGN